MPNIATWWCGQPAAREEVLSTTSTISRSPAPSAPRVPALRQRPVLAGELSASERDRLAAAIAERGIDYVGQEVVRLSTTPVLGGRPAGAAPVRAAGLCGGDPGRLDHVMPGGFCRISDRPDARAVSMGEGVRTADVWVLADKPVEPSTLLPAGDDGHGSGGSLGNLPSRAADNLFWLGRYLERAEATLRLVRSLCTPMDPERRTATARDPVERLQRLLVAWGAISQDDAADAAGLAAEALAERGRIRLGAVAGARGAAHRLVMRERLSRRCLAAHRRNGRAPGATRPTDRRRRCSSGPKRRCRTSRALRVWRRRT